MKPIPNIFFLLNHLKTGMESFGNKLGTERAPTGQTTKDLEVQRQFLVSLILKF